MALPPLTEALQPLLESLDEALHQRDRERRAGPAGRRPVQVLYGGAHLFKPGASARMGTLARAGVPVGICKNCCWKSYTAPAAVVASVPNRCALVV